MGTGQMMLTIGSIILLGSIILRMNLANSNVSQNFVNTKVALIGISTANSVMQEIMSKSFDENSAVKTSTTSLTAPNLLGKESGETRATFNDVDDFDKLQFNELVEGVDNFTVRCSVYYVIPPYFDKKVSSKTYYKKVIVQVNGTDDENIPIRLSQIKSYVIFW